MVKLMYHNFVIMSRLGVWCTYIIKVNEIMRFFVYFVSGTNRGRLLLFDAVVHGQVVESNEPIKEHVETKLIVKVAHEVSNQRWLFFRKCDSFFKSPK